MRGVISRYIVAIAFRLKFTKHILRSQITFVRFFESYMIVYKIYFTSGATSVDEYYQHGLGLKVKRESYRFRAFEMIILN